MSLGWFCFISFYFISFHFIPFSFISFGLACKRTLDQDVRRLEVSMHDRDEKGVPEVIIGGNSELEKRKIVAQNKVTHMYVIAREHPKRILSPTFSVNQSFFSTLRSSPSEQS